MSRKHNILNRSAAVEYIKMRGEVDRPGFKFTQVSNQALDKIEIHTKNYIQELLRSHPCIGKTFNP